MASFGSISFGVLIGTPGGDDDTDVSGIHIPGGNVTYYDNGGRITGSLSLTLRLTNTDYASLRVLVSTEATLTYPGGTYPNTMLKNLHRSFLGQDTAGTTLADAGFLVPT
jgi:hypothetical protein